MQIDFVGYSADCLISGHLNLTAPRLTDQLNEQPTIQLTDVVLEGLADAQRITIASYSLQRDELYAVKVTGPRGSKALRIITVTHRIQAQIGPYNVLGRLNAAPGASPDHSIASRGSMLPLTDATIAYVVGGILEVRDASAVIINRDLASWVRAEESLPAPEEAVLAGASFSEALG